MKVLNLYAGIGGNRSLWGGEVEVTAVELDVDIARVYQERFPQDKIIVGDAHQYLLEHFAEFDFVWSSPPCPSHSRIRNEAGVGCGQNEVIYAEMSLYQEIILLMHFFKGLWVVENVISYYDPLIKPQVFREHYYWANFIIDGKKHANRGHMVGIKELTKLKGVSLDLLKGLDKLKVLRNCVEPEAGKFVFDCAFKEQQKTLNEAELLRGTK